MANAKNFADLVRQNYDLLADNDGQNEMELTENITEEEREEVNAVIAEKQLEEQPQNLDTSDEFEDANRTVWHVSVNEAQIDYYSGKKDEESTKEQTKWAVKVFKGK